jgi:cystathionine beta-lyase/cystathionine gamma-synthase
MADPHAARSDSALGASAPLVPPLYQSAVYTLPDLDAVDRIANAEEHGFIYARDAHPNAKFLADELAAVEAAEWAVVCGSGMAAISATMLALLQPKDRIVASDRLYGRTTQLLGQELTRYGVTSAFIDTSDVEAVEAALDTPTRVLFVETVSNPLLRVADIEALAELAHERGCLLAVDNTFATPVLTRPMEMGADFVLESLTKLIGGHSDVTLGLVAGDDPDVLAQINQTASIWGFASNPFDCWLASRGLATLSLRMRAASASAAALADWLAGQRGVEQVIYPGRPEHEDHELAGRVLGGMYGNMLCFELDGGREAVNRFMRGARGIPFSPSLGHVTTTCSHPGTTSHRYVSAAERRRLGIGDGLIRLSVGVEELSQIQERLLEGLR